VLEDLTVHLEGKDIMKEMKFIILEQKFLEHIYAGKTFQALKVLQLEIRSEPQKSVTILRIQNSVPVCKNHLNEEFTPLLPIGIGEVYSQTISN
jgi:hypothetical protein